MNELASSDTERIAVREENKIHLPLGLLGFEQVKHYVLLERPDEAPFMRLQMLDPEGLSFVVLSPPLVLPSYEPELSAEDVAFLGLKEPSDALLLSIVTIHAHGEATMNLRGPVVLNRHTLVGKQVIPLNAASLALQHGLPACD